MANLKRRHAFKRWAPDIGENRDLPEPALYLEIATGLTAEQLAAMSARIKRLSDDIEALEKGEGYVERITAAQRLCFVEALGAYVRVQGGPHTVDGRPLANLEDYVGLVQGAADYGAVAMQDLIAAVRSFNSFTGADELFSLRRSGSPASTGPQSAEKAEPKTEGP